MKAMGLLDSSTNAIFVLQIMGLCHRHRTNRLYREGLSKLSLGYSLVAPKCSNVFLVFDFFPTDRVNAGHAVALTAKSNGGQHFKENVSYLSFKKTVQVSLRLLALDH